MKRQKTLEEQLHWVREAFRCNRRRAVGRSENPEGGGHESSDVVGILCSPLVGIHCCCVHIVGLWLTTLLLMSIVNRCLEILCQIAFSSVAHYFRSYRKKQFGIKFVDIYTLQ